MVERCHLDPIVSVLSKSGKINRILHPKICNYGMIAEIYTTEVARDIDPGWRLHKRANMYLTLLLGAVEIQIEDDDLISSVNMEKNLDNLMIIPSNTWFNFRGLYPRSVLLCMSSIPHDPGEIVRK